MMYLATSSQFGRAYYTESALDALHLIGEGHEYTAVWGNLDKDIQLVYTTFRGELASSTNQLDDSEGDE